jgi:hypothetical protein
MTLTKATGVKQITVYLNKKQVHRKKIDNDHSGSALQPGRVF